jgi:hypothetical protein
MTQADKNDPMLEAKGDPAPDADNWEAVALRRVARRVEDLPETPPEAEDFGWEEGVLEKLRKRLGASDRD